MTTRNSPPNADGDEQSASGTTGRTRRGVLQATGAAIAGAGLASVAGSASGAGVTIAPLARDGNQIVDPSGNAVTLRGVNVAEPGEQSRDWRGMDAEEVLDMATAHPDWSNVVVRVPLQPAFVGAGAAAGSGPAPSALPHGDEWGPAMPGTFDAATLVAYLDAVVDPLVERAETNGCYLVLVYDRHFPVFHHEEYELYVEEEVLFDAPYDDLADVWDCAADGSVDHTAHPDLTEDYDTLPTRDRHPDVCGERGVLWHGADQKDPIYDLLEEQQPWEYFQGETVDAFDSIDDVWLEPDALCHALDAELELFWEIVADRYAESDAVIFDVYDQPTGPYAGDWGGPERTAGAKILLGSPELHQFELWGDAAKPFYDLWVERSQPWMDVAEANGQGQLQTIGNPRWSQYVYWAPYNEYDTENVCYSAHVQLQQNCRPLQKTVGCPAEHVPVFFSDFGWMDHQLYVPTPWLGGPGTEGIDWATGETDPADERFSDERGESWSFERFLDETAVHPICSTFDHTQRPNFFDHGTPGEDGTGARGSEHWYDDGHLLETATPGEWWREYVNEHETEIEQGSGYYSHPEFGPNELHTTERGYAFPPGEHPAPGPCRFNDGLTPCERAGAADEATLDDGHTVCDLDGDGTYMDTNADGSLTNSDVTTFFRKQHTPAWNDYPEAFDFDGDERVGQSDVIALFETL